MKTLITTYLISVGFLVYIWFPDVMARPFHIIPRLAFYFGLPMAVFLSGVLILIAHYIGLKKADKITDGLAAHKPANDTRLNKEIKSA